MDIFRPNSSIHAHYLGTVNCYSWLACIWWWTYLIRAYLMIRTISSLACIHIYTMSHESRLLYSFADMWVLTNNVWWTVICFHFWLSSMQIVIISDVPLLYYYPFRIIITYTTVVFFAFFFFSIPHVFQQITL